ncbi:MAG: sensor domain-containing diguanylate cyclase [Ruminococcus sp.]|nr:sensor domain-containing diguanylate cyclase [Ruminococcus sp.]
MDKQTKSVAVQWIGPSVLLVIALMIMVFNFSTRSETKAYDTVTKNMMVSAQECLSGLTDQITLFETVGEPIASLLEKETALVSADTAAMLDVAAQHTGAWGIYLCDAAGNGINSAGEEVSIAGKAYFADIQSAADTAYFLTADDDITGKDVIIVSVPVKRQTEIAHILFFYPLDNFDRDVKKSDFVAWDMEALINSEGTVLIADGPENIWEQGSIIYDSLQGDNTEAGRKMKSRIANHTGGMVSVNLDGLEDSLVYIPTGFNDWMFVAGIQQEYVDRMVSQQWKDVKDMLFQLAAVIVVFLCIVVIINIISKLYNVKKQKQLEEKADTDLLTGLNNKLATERKIKEFIAKNPEAQSMMFILDIDNFKKINDTMGHAFGDEVLRSLGKQIGAIFRASDIVGRAGGDEFIVFLKNITDAEAVRKEAKKVEDFFKDFKAGEYTKYSATASIGVAIFPEEGEDFESIYKAADRALYMAKERGKNQLAFYKEKWLKEEA